MKIILPWPPSVNQMWRTVRGRPILSKIGREYRQAGLAIAVPIAIQTGPFLGPISVRIDAYYPDARRRDLDNLGKGPLDLLTHAGLWRDDSQIEFLSFRKSGIDRDRPRLELTVDALDPLSDNRQDP